MVKVFTESGEFAAYNTACTWLRDNGFSWGSMCHPQPTAIMKGDVYIAKWKNLTAKERRIVDGTITGDFREGPVTVKLSSPFVEEVVCRK